MFIVWLLLYIWQLPQHIVACGLILYYKISKNDIWYDHDGVFLVSPFCAGGVSLGECVFIHADDDSENARLHEKGHRIQSRMLGPLYLIVVGLPSGILNIAARYSPKISCSYYQIFPENWANKLGGVNKID